MLPSNSHINSEAPERARGLPIAQRTADTPPRFTAKSRDDPRTHHPGDPTDVLDAAGFTDTAPVAIPEITMTRAESIEMDERLDPTGGTWTDDGSHHPDLPPETNDTVSLPDLDL
jgi:hypothetical protein